MPDSANKKFSDSLTRHQVDLFRVERGLYDRIKAQLKELETSLISRFVEINPTGVQRKDARQKRIDKLIQETEKEIKRAYSSISRSATDEFASLAEVEALFLIAAVNDAVGSDITRLKHTEEMFQDIARNGLILGAPMAEWWGKQAGDTAYRFSAVVREGIAQGRSEALILESIRGTAANGYKDGIMNTSKRAAKTAVRTASASIMGEVRRQHYSKHPEVFTAIQQISVFDGRTSTTCQAYAGKMWDIKTIKPINHSLPYKGGVPRHPNCRSVERGVLDERFGQPARDLSFDQFLKTQSKSSVQDMLGKTKSDLYLSGRLPLSKLLDQKGRTLSVTQLREKHVPNFKKNYDAFLKRGYGEISSSNMAHTWAKNSKISYDQFEKGFNKVFKDTKLNYNLDRLSGQGIVSFKGEVNEVYKGLFRTFNLKDGYVKHDFLRLAENVQGQGIVKNRFADSMKLYQDMGLNSIKVHAALDRGAYAWARYGFIPTESSWKVLKKGILYNLSKIKTDVPDSVFSKVVKIANSDNPKMLWVLVDLKDRYNNDKIGKYLLLDEDWHGSLNMNDKEVMNRFWKYVGK